MELFVNTYRYMSHRVKGSFQYKRHWKLGLKCVNSKNDHGHFWVKQICGKNINTSITHYVKTICCKISIANKIVCFAYFGLWLISLFSLFRRINILLSGNFISKVSSGILIMLQNVYTTLKAQGSGKWSGHYGPLVVFFIYSFPYLKMQLHFLHNSMNSQMSVWVPNYVLSKFLFLHFRITFQFYESFTKVAFCKHHIHWDLMTIYTMKVIFLKCQISMSSLC